MTRWPRAGQSGGKTAARAAGAACRVSVPDLWCLRGVWPGVRRAGLPKAEPGADAAPRCRGPDDPGAAVHPHQTSGCSARSAAACAPWRCCATWPTRAVVPKWTIEGTRMSIELQLRAAALAAITSHNVRMKLRSTCPPPLQDSGGARIPFGRRWDNEGDWEIYGGVTATELPKQEDPCCRELRQRVKDLERAVHTLEEREKQRRIREATFSDSMTETKGPSRGRKRTTAAKGLSVLQGRRVVRVVRADTSAVRPIRNEKGD